MAEIDGDFEEYPSDAVWQRLPGETHRAYQAFCIYRDAGPLRSLRKTCQQFYDLPDLPPWDKNTNELRQIKLWSSTWDWVDRALAFTTHLDKLARIEQTERVKAMHQRHAALAQTGLQKARDKLLDIDGKRLSVSEAVKLLDVGTRVERMARGQASEIVETVDPVVSADRTLREQIIHNPAAAVAAAHLSIALTEAALAEQAAADGVTQTDDETEPDPEDGTDVADGPT